MIAAVTGSSGFIGSRLVDALVWRGWTVRRLVRVGTPAAAATPPARAADGPTPLGSVETHVVDFGDPHALAGSPALDHVDVVFHVGGVTKARSEDVFRAGNVAPTRALLDAIAQRMAAHDGMEPHAREPHAREPRVGEPRARVPRRFVLVSSQAAAGPAPSPDRPLTEDDPPQPFEAYGRSKLEAETVVREHPAGVPWTIVRPSAVYGPGDVDFLALFRQAARGLGVYPGRRDARLSIVYVDDLVDALVRAGTAPAGAGRTYFAETEAVTWRDVYRAVARAARNPLRVEVDVPRWALAVAGRAGDVAWRLTGSPMLVNSQKIALGAPQWWLCDGTRARDELGFVSRVSLSDGVTRTLAWYRDKGWM
jgi:nucleoside-diphosphate-sugar epimerase